MANQTDYAQPAFHEVVFRGKPKVVQALLHGLILGAGQDARIFFNFTDGIAHEGRTGRLGVKVGLRATDCHVVVDAGTSALIETLSGRIASETGLAIASHRRIASARLAFSFKAFSAQHDAEILEVVRGLPDGVALQDFQHEVKSDPGSRGVEAYSPAHDFESTGEGLLTGPVDRLVLLRRRMAELPLIAAQDIELVYA